MSTDQERAIDEDRVWRSQVRKAWYLRRHNFETTPNYNDYLEQVEDLVDELVSKQTREEGKKRLEELRKQFSAETAHNIGQHDAEQKATRGKARAGETRQDRCGAGTARDGTARS